jgi:hypothetical protein
MVVRAIKFFLLSLISDLTLQFVITHNHHCLADMPSSTSNLSVDEQQATTTVGATAKRKEDDTTAVTQATVATAQ